MKYLTQGTITDGIKADTVHVVHVIASYVDGSTQDARLGVNSAIFIDGIGRGGGGARLPATFTTRFQLVGGGFDKDGVASITLSDASHLLVKLDDGSQVSVEVDTTATSNNAVRIIKGLAADGRRTDPLIPLANVTNFQFTIDGAVQS
jgi:hypothetical protein